MRDIPKGTPYHGCIDKDTPCTQGNALSRHEGSEDIPLKGGGSSGGLTVLLYHRAAPEIRVLVQAAYRKLVCLCQG